MRFAFVNVLLLLAIQLSHADTPYWVQTEDYQFLTDLSSLQSFTLFYRAISIKFGQEEMQLLAQKQFDTDGAGKIVRVKSTDYDDQTTLVTEYEYDSDGRIEKEVLITESGVRFTLADYQYTGATRTRRRYSLDGLWLQTKEVLDGDGRIVESTSFSGNGAVTSSFIHEYTPHVMTTYGYDEKGKLTSKTVEYLSDGKATKREDYYDGKLYMTLVYQYDKSGRKVSEIGTYSSGKGGFRYDYTFSQDRMIKELVTFADGSQHQREFEYDDAGRLMKVTHSVRVEKFGKVFFEGDYQIIRSLQ